MANPVDERTLTQLLQRVAAGETSVGEAVGDLQFLPFEELAGAKIDHHRELRTGHAEAVFAPGKTPEQARDAASALVARATGAVFVTKATREQFDAVHSAVPDALYEERSGLIVAKRAGGGAPGGVIAVVSAGTSDLPISEEAAQTAEALGLRAERITDVGVAGLHRIIAARDQIEAAACVIVVAGMEGALPSVVAGLTSRPIVAVPTSVGYGSSFEGLSALLTMLNSCAAGVVVVNIDNGFGAAQAAHRILAAQNAMLGEAADS
jgi:NCAIR mutase (PurE)-related protein